MAGFDRHTGKVLDGFAHVQQSLEVIFSTPQGRRVMREWFGNPGLRLLGENATEANILRWITCCWVLVELFEPRFKITHFEVNSLDRLGFGNFTIVGRHNADGHRGWQQAAFALNASASGVSVAPAN